ncbi:MAG: hypothetical protein WCF84_20265 [Anaerolineae bacterium]
MKAPSPSLFALIMFVLLTLALTACNSGGSGTPTTAAQSPTPANAPTTGAVSATTAAATLAPATAAPTNDPYSAAAMPGIIAGTKTMTAMHVQLMTSGDAAATSAFYGIPTDNSMRQTYLQYDLNGKDYAGQGTGMFASFMDGSPKEFLEFAQVGDTLYVHGPASALQAPLNKWYTFPAGTSKFTVAPFEALDRIALAAGDWSAFAKMTGGGMADSQACDNYTTSKDPGKYLQAALSATPAPNPPTVYEGVVAVTACADGYIHNVTMRIETHMADTPDQRREITFIIQYSNIGKTTVSVPASALAQFATPTTAPVTLAFDGNWTGQTQYGDPIQFTVKNGQITNVNLSYSFPLPDCVPTGQQTRAINGALIQGNSFSVQFTDNQGTPYTFHGTLTSGTAKGSLDILATGKGCAGNTAIINWTAQSGTAAGGGSTGGNLKPTAAPTAIKDPTLVVKTFFDDLNANNLDGAMALLADYPVVNAGGASYPSKSAATTFFQGQLTNAVTFKVSGIKGNSSVITFTIQYGSATGSGKAILSNGRIDVLTLP